MSYVYYNENDPKAAAWLRELIGEKLIADGYVDERDIQEVKARDLEGWSQCHFFAGIGGWSYALQLAGWPDDKECWTGSCPCPSFSAAGKGQGFSDPRHLWPEWERLIRECHPANIFGEQVKAAIGHGWLDLVQSDLERESYTVGAAVLGACSVGAPHIRQRLYFGAHAGDVQRSGTGKCADAERSRRQQFTGDRSAEILPESVRERLQQFGDDDSGGSQPLSARLERHFGDVRDWRGPGWLDPHTARSVAEAGATRGFWADCDWWHARDEKYRPIKPGIFPLAHGVAERVGQLRGYGNAIVPQVAAEFVRAFAEAAEMTR
jgi:DNA (cytosine-5)-methyltransferase 1